MFDVNITFPFEAILLPVKAETRIKAIFTSGVPLSLEYERISIVVARRRSYSFHCKIENRLIGLIRKLVSLRDQKGHEFGKVPFKRNWIYADFTGRATFIKKQTKKQTNKSQKLWWFSKSCQTIQDGGSFFRFLIFSSIVFDSSKDAKKRPMLLFFLSKNL